MTGSNAKFEILDGRERRRWWTTAEGEVVAASEYRAPQNQLRELQRLLGKKTMETEILKDALEVAAGSKNTCCSRCRGRTAVPNESVCETLGVAHSNIRERPKGRGSG